MNFKFLTDTKLLLQQEYSDILAEIAESSTEAPS